VIRFGGRREPDRIERAAHPLAALRHRFVGEADNGEGRQTWPDLHLHIDAPGLDAFEGDGGDPREHDLPPFEAAILANAALSRVIMHLTTQSIVLYSGSKGITAMAMKLIETTLSETSVHLQLADDADLEKATEWLEFEVPLAPLMIDELNKLGNPATRHLSTIQVAALRYVRDAIVDETQRLARLLDRRA
jgi:hypothetical protein